MYVVLVTQIEALKDKDIFERHLKKEGFTPVVNEPFTYEGNTTTHLFSTRAFILEVVEKGLKKSGFLTCKIIFQVGKNPMEAYVFDTLQDSFTEVKL
jgi:hypothetical protein